MGAFVIFNTLSITVAQRTREFATLRMLGASRKQVMRSVVIEGIVIGLMASLIGLFLGIGIAKGMNELFKAIGLDLPEAGTVVAARTIVVSLASGPRHAGGQLVPARRATRVPPVAAVREGATLPARACSALAQGRRRRRVAAVVAISTGVFVSGLSGGAMALLMGGGVLALFVGVALVAPQLVKPLAASSAGRPAARAAWPAARRRERNAQPGRTAATAAALMIGLALVTVVAVLGAGLRGSVDVGRHRPGRDAAYVLSAKDGVPFAAAEGDRLAKVGVTPPRTCATTRR